MLIAVAGLLTAAATLGAPADADANTDENFIDALNHAGVDFGQPGNAMAVGESVCPMLTQPGGSFDGAVANIRRQGISPQMAQVFTTIAIQTYCPDMIANLTNGNMLGGIPGAPMPGMPNMVGGNAAGLPQITGPGI